MRSRIVTTGRRRARPAPGRRAEPASGASDRARGVERRHHAHISDIPHPGSTRIVATRTDSRPAPIVRRGARDCQGCPACWRAGAWLGTCGRRPRDSSRPRSKLSGPADPVSFRPPRSRAESTPPRRARGTSVPAAGREAVSSPWRTSSGPAGPAARASRGAMAMVSTRSEFSVTVPGSMAALHSPRRRAGMGELNFLDPDFLADPYPAFHRLRAEDPVHRHPLGFYVLTRYDDVAAFLRDPRFGKSGYQALFESRFGGGPEGSVARAVDAVPRPARPHAAPRARQQGLHAARRRDAPGARPGHRGPPARSRGRRCPGWT